MKKLIIIFNIAFFLFIQHVVIADVDGNFWDSYQNILKDSVSENRFTTIDGEFTLSSTDYEKIKNGPELVGMIGLQLKKLETVKGPEELKDKLAFWINAYNFFTIVDVVNNYPVAGMGKIGWKNKRHNVGGTLYSLDNIEHNIIRPLKDPRIHFAVNCASVGCPSLSTEIFTGGRIDEQLDRAVTNALKNPLHLRLMSNGKVYTTQLFKWFGKDFRSGGFKGVEAFIRKYAPERLRKFQKIAKKIDYDWDLNTKQNILKKMKDTGRKFSELKLTLK